MEMVILAFGIVLAGCLGFWLISRNLLLSFQTQTKQAIDQHNRSFFDLAKSSLYPVQETLKQIEVHQRELEKQRIGSYASLSQQLEGMIAVEKELRKETAHLAQALRSPNIRGSWGQIHLRRVVEIAGLLNRCDFFEQKSMQGTEKILRPDVVVQLPGERCIAIDAKTPLHAYLEAHDEIDERIREKKLQDHALSVRKHIKDLSLKEYWKQLAPSPEYVILFLPAEAIFSAALQSDPTLIEVGVEQNIVVATPTTLIAILKAVAFSWKQEALAQSTREIAQLGQELYDRIGTVTEHWVKVGKSLENAIDSYNKSMASLESRVLVTARRLKEAGELSGSFSEPGQITQPLSLPRGRSKLGKQSDDSDALSLES